MSVLSSATVIALGISKSGLRNGSSFLSRSHRKMVSQIILILFVLSEIAFVGGLSRFSFAIKFADIYPFSILTAFAALASGLSMIPIVSNRMQFSYVEFWLFFSKLAIWTTILSIYCSVGSFQESSSALVTNGAYDLFFTTMTFSSVVNFTFGFFLLRHKTNFILYDWIEQILVLIIGVLNEKVLTDLDKTTVDQASGKNIEQVDTCDVERVESMITISDQSSRIAVVDPDVEADVSQNEIQLDQAEVLDASRSDLSPSIDIQVFSVLSEEQLNKAPSKEELEETEKKSTSFFLPLSTFVILLAILSVFFMCPLKLPEVYHVQLYPDCKMQRGFPIVSASKETIGGSICIDGKEPMDIFRIAQVIF